MHNTSWTIIYESFRCDAIITYCFPQFLFPEGIKHITYNDWAVVTRTDSLIFINLL